MRKQNLPIKVIEELEEMSLFIKKEIDTHKFTVKKYEDFGFQVVPKSDVEFYFSVDSYNSIDYSSTHYLINIFPSTEHSVEVEAVEITLKDFKKLLIKWINLIERYAKYSPDAIQDFFKFSTPIAPEEDVFEEKDKVLSYCLKTLSVSNFQGVKHTMIENLPVDTQWVFLVGENGFGKSTILQSILLGLNGSKDGNYELIQDKNIDIQVEYKSDKQNYINDCWHNLHPLIHVAAYGPSRLNLQADATISDEARKSSVAYGLFNSDGALLNIEAKMKDWLLQKDEKRFNLVKKAFCKLIPYLADVQYNPKTSQIEYIEKDVIDGKDTYEPLPYYKLASGFRAIIGLAGDIIVRLSHTQPKVSDPAKLKGIVIIDELDLHWHPKLQKQIPQLFSTVFPKIQFIVSTHSPIPLLGAPHNSVILKVTRTKEEGIQIERVNVDIKYLTPNLLLTSGIFDMDDVLSVNNDDITKTRTEDTFEEMKHNDEVEKYLAEFEASNRQFPDALFEPKTN